MNLQHYTDIYCSFHNVFEHDVIENTILIPISDVSWAKSIVLRLKNFKEIYEPDKPLAKSIMYHYKMETVVSVFTSKDSWSILLGDQRVVYPKSGSHSYIGASSLFIKDSKIFEQYMKERNAISYYDNIYSYKNAVIYLDNYDIPYPGGHYFNEKNVENDQYRICFVGSSEIIQLLEKEFLEKLKAVNYMPLKVKDAEATISDFINLKPIRNAPFSSMYHENVSNVLKRKCFTDPNYIIQDILNKSFSSEIGIIIEYPIYISYLSPSDKLKHNEYVALAINCNIPKSVLYVPAPYDRCYLHRQVPKNIHWVTLLYDKEPETLEAVILNKNIIGYMYRETFFCLTHPKLMYGTHVENKHTKDILNMLSFDLKQDENLKIVNEFRYDVNHSLFCVKHKNLSHELWCLSFANNFKSHPKRVSPSYLVSHWCELVLQHADRKEVDYGDLNLLKLMFVLARHKICFQTKESLKRDIRYENHSDIIFTLEKNVLDFVNSLRLDLMMPLNEPESEYCTIL